MWWQHPAAMMAPGHMLGHIAHRDPLRRQPHAAATGEQVAVFLKVLEDAGADIAETGQSEVNEGKICHSIESSGRRARTMRADSPAAIELSI